MIFNTNSGGVTQEQLDAKVSQLNSIINMKEKKHQYYTEVLSAGSGCVTIGIIGGKDNRRMLSVYTDEFGVNPTSITETYNTMTTNVNIYFSPREEDLNVVLEVSYYELL